ncbi:MAG: NAD(P)-dependent oxidoreductase [Candidatus Lokiarchaeota archaeon]
MSKLNVMLTGASGMVGKKILEELLLRGSFSIRVFLRNSKKNRKLIRSFGNNRIEVVWGSLENPEEVFKAVENQEIIIHVAALQPSNKNYDEEKVHLVNVIGTQNILKAMKKQKNARIIYTSSISVYGDRLKNPNIEITDPVVNSDHDLYAKSKLEAENLIKDSGLDYLIFRLSYCTSTEMLRFQSLMFDMPLDTRVEIIDTRDIAKAIVNSIPLKKVWNRTFNLGGGPKCQIIFRDHFNDIVEIMGFGREFLPEEAFAKGRFHCGFYDTTEVQDLLKFQEHTLQDFYDDIRRWIGIKRYFVPLVKPIVRCYLLKKSKYYSEFKKKKK